MLSGIQAIRFLNETQQYRCIHGGTSLTSDNASQTPRSGDLLPAISMGATALRFPARTCKRREPALAPRPGGEGQVGRRIAGTWSCRRLARTGWSYRAGTGCQRGGALSQLQVGAGAKNMPSHCRAHAKVTASGICEMALSVESGCSAVAVGLACLIRPFRLTVPK